MKGIVIKSTGSWFTVRNEEADIFNCKIKGSFRIKGIRTTNPVAVGDKVVFDLEADEKTGVINEILPRHNYIIRKATNLSKSSHIIAANIDQCILVATLALPRTSSGFIDRFLVTSEAYHIPAIIVFNKLDLYNEARKELLEVMINTYNQAEYRCIITSAVDGSGLDLLKECMQNKVSLLAGHSGVGKSTLINALQPELDLKTKEISRVHEKGQHATTFAEMIPLSFGGYIIDTPGIKEFGLIDFDKNEVAERFPEMRKYMHDCRFANCTHSHEPGCAVKVALEEGKISKSRYENYLRIFNHEDWDEKEWD